MLIIKAQHWTEIEWWPGGEGIPDFNDHGALSESSQDSESSLGAGYNSGDEDYGADSEGEGPEEVIVSESDEDGTSDASTDSESEGTGGTETVYDRIKSMHTYFTDMPERNLLAGVPIKVL